MGDAMDRSGMAQTHCPAVVEACVVVGCSRFRMRDMRFDRRVEGSYKIEYLLPALLTKDEPVHCSEEPEYSHR